MKSFIFNYTDIITQSVTRDLGLSVSREIRQVVLSDLEKIVSERLPMEGGIQHLGYRIACLTMINSCKGEGSIKVEELRTEIEAVPNKADQAFLYAHVARYLNRTSDKSEFIDLAIKNGEH